jgi:excisionase family DNA binding protein
LSNSAAPLVYTLHEAAERLKVSGKTVRRLVAAGRLARVRGLRRLLIPAGELERFVEENSRSLGEGRGK